jgi:hypothetical protein
MRGTPERLALPGSLPRSRVAPEGLRNRGLPEELQSKANGGMMSGQPLSIASLKVALSEERLAAYTLESDADELDGVARYLWTWRS